MAKKKSPSASAPKTIYDVNWTTVRTNARKAQECCKARDYVEAEKICLRLVKRIGPPAGLDAISLPDAIEKLTGGTLVHAHAIGSLGLVYSILGDCLLGQGKKSDAVDAFKVSALLMNLKENVVHCPRCYFSTNLSFVVDKGVSMLVCPKTDFCSFSIEVPDDFPYPDALK